jgi:hypothetical protein
MIPTFSELRILVKRPLLCPRGIHFSEFKTFRRLKLFGEAAAAQRKSDEKINEKPKDPVFTAQPVQSLKTMEMKSKS